MTRRQRVITAISHKEPDFTPYQLNITTEAKEKTAKYLGDENFLDKVGNHLGATAWGTFTEIKKGYYQDQFGVVWNRTVDKDIGIVDGLLLPEPNLDNYQFPDPYECPATLSPKELTERYPDQFRLVDIGFSLFERAWTLRGMENLLMDMVLNQVFVEELMEKITDYNLVLIDRSMKEYEFDCVAIGDDWGQQTGLIFGLDNWRKFIKPSLKRMFEAIKSKGKYIILHSCGKVDSLFPDLIDIGLDVFNTFQPEVMDPDEMKREYGKDLTFYGGISTQTVLPYKTPAEVRQIVKDMIQRVGTNGGYIVAPTHDMPRDIPPENVVAFIEAVQNQ